MLASQRSLIPRSEFFGISRTGFAILGFAVDTEFFGISFTVLFPLLDDPFAYSRYLPTADPEPFDTEAVEWLHSAHSGP